VSHILIKLLYGELTVNLKSIIVFLLCLVVLPAIAKPDVDKINNGKASEHTNASDKACEKGSGSFCNEPTEIIPDVTEPTEVIPDVTEPTEVIPDVTESTEVIPDVTESIEVSPDVTESTEVISDITKPTIPTPDVSKSTDVIDDGELENTFGMLKQDSVIKIYTFNTELVDQPITELELVGLTIQDGVIKIRRVNGTLNQFSTSFNTDDAKCVEIRIFDSKGMQSEVFLALPEDESASLPCKYEEPEDKTPQDVEDDISEEIEPPKLVSDEEQISDNIEVDSTSTDSVETPENPVQEEEITTTDEKPSDNTTQLPPIDKPPTTGKINTVGNFGGITVTDVEFEAGASVSNLILSGNNFNKGLISNATILPDSTLTCEDGKLTGTIENQGTITNCYFVGSELNGGYLDGIITVIDEPNLGILNNVTILPNANVINGILAGNIDNQGILSDVIIQSGSTITGGVV